MSALSVYFGCCTILIIDCHVTLLLLKFMSELSLTTFLIDLVWSKKLTETKQNEDYGGTKGKLQGADQGPFKMLDFMQSTKFVCSSL